MGYTGMFNSYEEMLEELEREMRRISDDMLLQMFRLPGAAGEVWTPRVDIYETKDKVVVKVSAAGVKPDQMDVQLSADNKFITIRGMRSEEDAERQGLIRYHQLEVYYGPFERIVALPTDVPLDRENLHATYRDGFLIISLPKKKKEEEIRNVPITD